MSPDQWELIRTQAQYSVLRGGLYIDAGEHHLAESWLDRALGLSHLATDHDLTVFILTCKALLANYMRMATDAIGVGEHALGMAPLRSRLAVIAASRAAYGYALNGDRAATQRTNDRARELLDTLDDDPDSPYGPWLNENWINLSQAQSWAVLGDYQRAAQIFQNALVDFPNRYRRARGLIVARTALAHACAYEVEQAATLGLNALPIGVQTGSVRLAVKLVLGAWKSPAANGCPLRTAMGGHDAPHPARREHPHPGGRLGPGACRTRRLLPASSAVLPAGSVVVAGGQLSVAGRRGWWRW